MRLAEYNHIRGSRTSFKQKDFDDRIKNFMRGVENIDYLSFATERYR